MLVGTRGTRLACKDSLWTLAYRKQKGKTCTINLSEYASALLENMCNWVCVQTPRARSPRGAARRSMSARISTLFQVSLKFAFSESSVDRSMCFARIHMRRAR